MRTVHEVSKLTGVSVRTLHYYDAIDLLKPAKVTEAGYRLYDDTALGRLQSILLFRELRFPLKEIREILDSPNFNPAEALEQQITLLELQKKHIEKLIAFAREIQEKGVYKMEFDAFDKSEWNQYAEEVKERWGQTRAYEECEEKMKEKTENEVRDTADQMMEIFAEIGKLQHLSPEDNRVQEKIETLQSFISEHYYTCTKEILSGLGQMYVGDERMKRNIDKAGGDGTAEFAAQAIEIFVH
ncbi:MerR family transcriptional regulator [Dorea sp. YH-dor226]|uniref:MerR family transcriptional regulator n=1 Tax=Dorea sp. YH-dor226 TaxID=3151119 RepID=UPI003242972A